jgi:hypothetical protein
MQGFVKFHSFHKTLLLFKTKWYLNKDYDYDDDDDSENT